MQLVLSRKVKMVTDLSIEDCISTEYDLVVLPVRLPRQTFPKRNGLGKPTPERSHGRREHALLWAVQGSMPYLGPGCDSA